MRIRTLIALIENHGYYQRSISGFKTDLPVAAAHLEKVLKQQEEYELLYMITQVEKFEHKYMVFVNARLDVLVIERMEHYPREYWEVISKSSGIALEKFQEIFEATTA